MTYPTPETVAKTIDELLTLSEAEYSRRIQKAAEAMTERKFRTARMQVERALCYAMTLDAHYTCLRMQQYLESILGIHKFGAAANAEAIV